MDRSRRPVGFRLATVGLRLGLFSGCFGCRHSSLELLLELLLTVQQTAQRELPLAHTETLRLVAVDATLQQLVFLREVEDRFAQGGILRLGF